MTPGWIVAAAGAAAATGPWLRATIFRHSTAHGRPLRRDCPRCRQPVTAILASRLPVTGCCPHCHWRIGPPPGLVEVTAAAVLGLATWRSPTLWILPAVTWLCLVGVILSFVDSSVHRLPDRLTAAAAVGTTIALTAASLHGGHLVRLLGAAAGTVVAGLLYLTVLMLRPAAVGLGDVKTAAVVGLVLGWLGLRPVFAGLAAGVLIGAVVGLGLLVLGRRRWQQPYAHGPALLAGALLAFCWTP